MGIRNVIVIAAFFLGIGLVCWKLLSAPAVVHKPPHVALVLDPSDSLRPDSEGKAVRGLIDNAIRRPGLVDGSTVTVVIVGDASTNYEPISLPAIFAPVSRRLMEGRGAIEKKRRETVDDAVKRYLETATVIKSSPIWRAAKRSLEQLAAAGCGPGVGCELYIRSDGEETEEEHLRDAIRRGKAPKKAVSPSLDNSSVDIVRWCGLSETHDTTPPPKGKRRSGKHRSIAAELVTELWKGEFSDPQKIVFAPFCPVAESGR